LEKTWSAHLALVAASHPGDVKGPLPTASAFLIAGTVAAPHGALDR
jgi:hypothetical protein